MFRVINCVRHRIGMPTMALMVRPRFNHGVNSRLLSKGHSKSSLGHKIKKNVNQIKQKIKIPSRGKPNKVLPSKKQPQKPLPSHIKKKKASSPPVDKNKPKVPPKDVPPKEHPSKEFPPKEYPSKEFPPKSPPKKDSIPPPHNSKTRMMAQRRLIRKRRQMQHQQQKKERRLIQNEIQTVTKQVELLKKRKTQYLIIRDRLKFAAITQKLSKQTRELQNRLARKLNACLSGLESEVKHLRETKLTLQQSLNELKKQPKTTAGQPLIKAPQVSQKNTSLSSQQPVELLQKRERDWWLLSEQDLKLINNTIQPPPIVKRSGTVSAGSIFRF